MSQSTGFSLDAISKLRAEAHAAIRHHAAEIVSISSAVADVDACLRLTIAERSIDEAASLVATAGKLAALIDGSAVAT